MSRKNTIEKRHRKNNIVKNANIIKSQPLKSPRLIERHHNKRHCKKRPRKELQRKNEIVKTLS